MASAWADKLPRVRIARGETPKRVTFIYPFYENAQFLQRHLKHWAAFPAELRKHLSAIIVDDGSPTPARFDVVAPFPIRLFRIDIDIKWNWLAARNIGAHHADEGWLLLTDMDHLIPATTASSMIYGRHDPACVYAFSRTEHTGQIIAPHSASFLMTREMFWKTGGYDEALSGHYGTDGEFRRRVARVAPIQVLTDDLVRYEYVTDSSTSRYPRKLPADADAVRRLVEARSKDWTPKVLSFPYGEVSC